MAYDLVIKNGTVIDGSGMPRFRADVGVSGGRIATIGRIRESAQQTIDAEGHVVTPGFVDGHTHMDAQIFWDPLGTSSCYHGITTVVMGNCGFTLAPCAEKDKHLVVRNLQRAEDIPPAAMEAGIKWSWTTYPEFLEALEALPKGINYAGYVGHSAIRTFVMGERAFDGPATEDDLKAMEHHVRDAIRAGAMGFTSSRSPSHETPGRLPGGEPQRHVGRGAPAGGSDGRAERRHLRDRGRRRGPEGRRPGRARVAYAAARSRGRVRPADHLRGVQPARLARHLEALPRSPRRDRGRGRTHVRAGAQPVALGAALVQDPDAVRPLAGVEGHPQAADRGTEAEAPRSGAAAQAHRDIGRERRAQAARHRGAAGRLRLAVRARHRGRAAPLGGARSRASATSIRPRP